MVNPKHLATFLLGAAAGAAMMKYNSMTEDEKEKMMTDLKDKAETVKNEAEEGLGKLKDYFEELSARGASAIKEQMNSNETLIKDFMGGNKSEETAV